MSLATESVENPTPTTSNVQPAPVPEIQAVPFPSQGPSIETLHPELHATADARRPSLIAQAGVANRSKVDKVLIVLPPNDVNSGICEFVFRNLVRDGDSVVGLSIVPEENWSSGFIPSYQSFGYDKEIVTASERRDLDAVKKHLTLLHQKYNKSLNVEARVIRGSPVEAVVGVVELVRPTVVVVAHHVQKGLKFALSPKISLGILEKSPAPVILVRPDVLQGYSVEATEPTRRRSSVAFPGLFGGRRQSTLGFGTERFSTGPTFELQSSVLPSVAPEK